MATYYLHKKQIMYRGMKMSSKINRKHQAMLESLIIRINLVESYQCSINEDILAYRRSQRGSKRMFRELLSLYPKRVIRDIIEKDYYLGQYVPWGLRYLMWKMPVWAARQLGEKLKKNTITMEQAMETLIKYDTAIPGTYYEKVSP